MMLKGAEGQRVIIIVVVIHTSWEWWRCHHVIIVVVGVVVVVVVVTLRQHTLAVLDYDDHPLIFFPSIIQDRVQDPQTPTPHSHHCLWIITITSYYYYYY